ncbi:hypothetical protein TetV_409 [Tetraselmis virus 1]|uniref:Uncharacterized protein n=1 Tax=Tetraselmis virus 1 TaxID=2060617 RepID=A0A2P0VNL3_9VIRU|nr:hypothetical protein QJ968_gp645 [Tetraselmis virus 1]AUF82491.1 hypothetical protein TetV_409 [Tetraselmis virus 1]
MNKGICLVAILLVIASHAEANPAAWSIIKGYVSDRITGGFTCANPLSVYTYQYNSCITNGYYVSGGRRYATSPQGCANILIRRVKFLCDKRICSCS